MNEGRVDWKLNGTTLIAICVQTVAIAFWAGTMTERVGTLESAIEEASVERAEIAQLSTKVTAVETLLQALIDRYDRDEARRESEDNRPR